MIYSLSLIRDQLIRKQYSVSPLYGPDVRCKTIRFHLSNAGPVPDHLYLLLADDGASRIQCLDSYFLLRGLPYDVACETVIDLCQQYDQWERDLLAFAWKTPDFQAIIDRSDTVFENPVYISNWQGGVLGYSSAYHDAVIRDFWHSVTHERRMPLSTLASLRSSQYSYVLSQPNQIHELYYPSLHYRSLLGLVKVKQEIVLQFQIIEYSRPLSESDKLLAEVFLHALRRVFREGQMAEHESALHVYHLLLDEQAVSGPDLNWSLHYLGWDNPSMRFFAAAFSSRDHSACDESLYPHLEMHLPGCRLLNFQDEMVMLLPEAVFHEFRADLLYVLDSLRLFCAISFPFSDWTTLAFHYRMAKKSLSRCSASQPLYACSDHTWQYLLHALSEHAALIPMIHPAIPILQEYDRRNEMDLCQTLFQYLCCERNHIKTARVLSIHRNTLAFRLQRISQLTDLDLDDLDTRMHLLISFQLLSSSDRQPLIP